MRTFLSGLITALALAAAPSFAQPDIVKRPVQFAKGKSSATSRAASPATRPLTTRCAPRPGRR